MKSCGSPAWTTIFRSARPPDDYRRALEGLPSRSHEAIVAFRVGTAPGAQLRTQPVEFLEFVQVDLQQTNAFYDAWQTSWARKFHDKFRDAIAWIEWNPDINRKPG